MPSERWIDRKKRTNADEFLVEKKILWFCSKFGDLPSPEENIETDESNDIEDLLISSGSEENVEDIKINSDIEKSILKEIRE